ncbi:MAG: endonuclease [Gammaproteobacteria bacterium]|nr:endonuclease [Gammaproteobacteria bacterium]NIR28842.1 endonuclease [Gammaproteobacteria bacterium]NIR97223.1 endonuclease [Gammaproteobacteria bacterium]NIT62934.1 endonuclease [Gammaproteobacteria bacterium]NIV20624.1 endonuclease [Gammaproteobacteria bacterium]
MSRRALRAVYRRLHRAQGPQQWWPGETPFEVMVGAILTQNTAWVNVERAIANLKARERLDPAGIVAARHDHLAGWIRPSGYFNVKAQRLKAFCGWYLERGGHERLKRWPTTRLRAALLDVPGVGRETADDILLYAFHRPVFVIDAYTRRLFARLGMATGGEDYDALRAGVEDALGPDAPLFNEYHALIVNHGKDICKVAPRCAGCCLRERCPTGRSR